MPVLPCPLCGRQRDTEQFHAGLGCRCRLTGRSTVFPCLACGARGWASEPVGAVLTIERIAPPPCPECGGSREFRTTHWVDDPGRAAEVSLICDSCRRPKLGTLAWARVPLFTNPTAGSPLATSDHERALARFRLLMSQCFDIPEDRWGRSDGRDHLGRAWYCLIDNLIRSGQAASRDAAYVMLLSAVIPILESEVLAQGKVPARLPFDEPPSAPPATLPGRQPAPDVVQTATGPAKTLERQPEGKQAHEGSAETTVTPGAQALAAAYLFTDPAAGERVATGDHGRALARFRLLMTQCFDIPAQGEIPDRLPFDEASAEPTRDEQGPGPLRPSVPMGTSEGMQVHEADSGATTVRPSGDEAAPPDPAGESKAGPADQPPEAPPSPSGEPEVTSIPVPHECQPEIPATLAPNPAVVRTDAHVDLEHGGEQLPPQSGDSSAAVDPPTEADLALELRSRGATTAAALVELMKGRDQAEALEVGERVHDDGGASDKTIRGNCNRVNAVAEELGCELRYRLAGGLVWKRLRGA